MADRYNLSGIYWLVWNDSVFVNHDTEYVDSSSDDDYMGSIILRSDYVVNYKVDRTLTDGTYCVNATEQMGGLSKCICRCHIGVKMTDRCTCRAMTAVDVMGRIEK